MNIIRRDRYIKGIYTGITGIDTRRFMEQVK